MKKFILFLLCFSWNLVSSQTIQQIDSVAVKMCESLASMSNDIKDDAKTKMIFQKHLPDFYDKLKITSQEIADSVSRKLFYRLQRNCKLFSDLQANLKVNKSDWQTLSQKPIVNLSKRQWKIFLKGGDFYYKEYDGKIVSVKIESGFWIEQFEDNTTSQLRFLPKKNNEFSLQFITSNNDIRANLSVKDEYYNYGVYFFENGNYGIWIEAQRGVIDTFILYSIK